MTVIENINIAYVSQELSLLSSTDADVKVFNKTEVISVLYLRETAP